MLKTYFTRKMFTLWLFIWLNSNLFMKFCKKFNIEHILVFLQLKSFIFYIPKQNNWPFHQFYFFIFFRSCFKIIFHSLNILKFTKKSFIITIPIINLSIILNWKLYLALSEIHNVRNRLADDMNQVLGYIYFPQV